MANVPGPDQYIRVFNERSVVIDDAPSVPLQNLQDALSRSIKWGFPAFSIVIWILLGMAIIGFVALHIAAGLHWAFPDLWLSGTALDNLEQKLTILWSRVGGWVFPLAYFVWQVISTRRE